MADAYSDNLPHYHDNFSFHFASERIIVIIFFVTTAGLTASLHQLLQEWHQSSAIDWDALGIASADHYSVVRHVSHTADQIWSEECRSGESGVSAGQTCVGVDWIKRLNAKTISKLISCDNTFKEWFNRCQCFGFYLAMHCVLDLQTKYSKVSLINLQSNTYVLNKNLIFILKI